MNPVQNPYSPGAGTPPPELVGRDEIYERARIAMERIRLGKSAQSILMVGLRGVGKTVLLEKIRKHAESRQLYTPYIEAVEKKSLPALLVPQLRITLLKLSSTKRARDFVEKGMKALVGFARACKIKYGVMEAGFDPPPEPGLADSGDLEQDLSALLETVGTIARKTDTAVVMFIDELQYTQEEQLAALIGALHRCAYHQLPITLIGAGLPQLRERTGRAKSYAERLFEFPNVGALDAESAKTAIVRPAEKENVRYADDAVAEIVRQTKGYPYFLQEWGKHSWNCAEQSPITLPDVESASRIAVATLDESFFRVRLDRLTPSETKYLRAMADLGPGPHRSGDIAHRLARKVASVAPVRSGLIKSGTIWSPNHGDTAFTVPLFDRFMRRHMPDNEWENA